MKAAAMLAGFVVFTLLGNLFFKRGATEIATAGFSVDAFFIVLRSANAWMGALFYSVAAVCWFLALSVVQLNIAITVSACIYVLVVLMAFFLFQEAIPPTRWIGIGLIFIGLIVVGQTL